MLESRGGKFHHNTWSGAIDAFGKNTPLCFWVAKANSKNTVIINRSFPTGIMAGEHSPLGGGASSPFHQLLLQKKKCRS